MLRIVAIILLLVAVNTEQSESAPITGGEMLSACERALETNKLGDYRSGYCAGVVTAFLIYSRYLDEPRRWCPPNEVTVGQSIRAIVTYTQEHPAQLHQQFFAVMLTALRRAWPCK